MLVDALNTMEQHHGGALRPAKTMRFPMAPPRREDIDLPTFDFVDGLLNRLNQALVPVFQNPRADDAYYLLLVGAPNQQALIEAMNKYRPKCMMIGIGNAHEFAQTLNTIDWAQHILDIHNAGGTVYTFAETDPIMIVENAWRTCRIHNPTRIDHFTALIQGDPETQNRVAGHIAETLMLSITQLGFFHDECVMLWNTYQNRKTGKVRVFQRADEAPDIPVFILASGPSLENDIDIIRQHRTDAIILSIATALRPVLNAGITPDFHVELENVYITPKMIELSKDHDLSGIRLVAAASVEPAVLDYFDEAILYARTALSSYPVFAHGEDETLSLPGPTAGNAGLSFALESGFKDIYLFGLDLGTRNPTQHHTSGSFYDTDDAPAHTDEYNIQVPGNFGEPVWTSRPFLSALKNADDLIGAFNTKAKVRNCSDGAMLSHAKAVRASQINRQGHADKTLAIENLCARFKAIHADDTKWPRDLLMPEIKALIEKLRSILTDPDALLDDSYEQKILDVLMLPIGYRDPTPLGADMAALMLVRGTVLAMTVFMERYRGRIGASAALPVFAQQAAAQYMTLLNELEQTSTALFDGSEPEQPAPVDARIASANRAFPAPIRVPRNSDCPCGSGVKFKKCHGKAA